MIRAPGKTLTTWTVDDTVAASSPAMIDRSTAHCTRLNVNCAFSLCPWLESVGRSSICYKCMSISLCVLEQQNAYYRQIIERSSEVADIFTVRGRDPWWGGTQCQPREEFQNGIRNPPVFVLTGVANDEGGWVFWTAEWRSLFSHPNRSQSVAGSVRNNLQVNVLGVERLHSHRHQEQLCSRGWPCGHQGFLVSTTEPVSDHPTLDISLNHTCWFLVLSLSV